MKVTILLADAAQAVDGKLYILGGGWSIVGPMVLPYAIAIKIEVPWDMANRTVKWLLSLLDADGKQVTTATPTGDEPVRVDGQFEVGRPPGLVPGTPLDVVFALQVAPIPLAPGR